MPHVVANGIKLAYKEVGSGEPLLLIHGTQSDRRQFDLFLPLPGDGIRAIAYDQRDSADSPYDGPNYGMREHAADCAAFISGLGLERAHLLGTSYGGCVAMMTAIHHPEKIQSVILAATTPAWAMVSNLGERGVAVNAEGKEAVDRFMLSVVLSPEAIDNDPVLVAETKAALLERPPAILLRRFAALMNHDCRADLGRIKSPTLVLHGADDLLIKSETAKYMAEHIPGAKLHLLPGSRHGLSFEHRQRTADVAREFVLAHAGADPSRARR